MTHLVTVVYVPSVILSPLLSCLCQLPATGRVRTDCADRACFCRQARGQSSQAGGCSPEDTTAEPRCHRTTQTSQQAAAAAALCRPAPATCPTRGTAEAAKQQRRLDDSR
jgi:hypothetical protein